MREVLQDIDYYRNSGGGITISGGEVACQPEFVAELLAAAKEAGIATAIETNMLADWPVYEKLIPLLDLVMLDIKHADSAAHEKWTGTGNDVIIENAGKIAALLPVIVRTPIIPGVNDTPEAIGKIAEIVKSLDHVQYYELLLYNPLGESKYKALGMENMFEGEKPASEELQKELKAAASRAGVSVRVG